jgi:hypothetical protein
MKLREIQKLLDAEVLTGTEHLDDEVYYACAGDLMGDVLSYRRDQAILLTGLLSPYVIQCAEMASIGCVVFVRCKVPDEEMLAIARELDIVVMTTTRRMFSSCGLLYEAGLCSRQS